MAGQPPRRSVLRNPFFAILLAVSTLFVLTVLGYLVSPYVLAPPRALPPREGGSLALAAWLDRNGPQALGIEFLLMSVAGIFAMATEDWFSPRSRSRRLDNQS